MYKDKEQKKAYDRQHMKKVYQKYKTKRVELITKFGSKCFICDGTHLLQFHHLEYGELGKYGHASLWRRIQHNREIEEYPERFKLLCSRCHFAVTMIKGMKDKYPKLMSLV